MAFHPDWLIPDWPAPEGVRAVFTSRAGGHSGAPWDSFNLGDHVGDHATTVQLNRDQLHRTIEARAVFLRQVHGCEVLVLDHDTPHGQPADAAVTCRLRLACTIMVADCLPILLTNGQGSCVGALHAGWRGLASGVVEATVRALRERGDGEWMAWLGPCIGPSAFEVGSEVRAAFERNEWVNPDVVQAAFVPHADPSGSVKYRAHLPLLAAAALRHCGVNRIYGNLGQAQMCTVSHPSRFFSHRRDAAARGGDIRSTGRMAACIWRT